MARAQRIFAGRKFRLGPLTRTNDPKESKDWRFTLTGSSVDELMASCDEALSTQFSLALKGRTKVGCFSTDSAPLSGDHTRDFYRRGFSKPRMWAHYADKHAGVCLAFDKRKLDQQIRTQVPAGDEVLSGPVEYVSRYFVSRIDEGDYQINIGVVQKIGIDRYARLHRKTFCQRLFFQKMHDWRDETEFRWVIFSQTEAELYIDFGDTLTGVIFGDRVSDSEVEQALRNLPLDVQVMGVKWKNCGAWYDFGALRYNRQFRAETGLYSG